MERGHIANESPRSIPAQRGWDSARGRSGTRLRSPPSGHSYEPLRGPMAYLAGQRCLRKGKAREKEAPRLFELAGKHGRQDPVLTRLAQTEVDRLRGK